MTIQTRPTNAPVWGESASSADKVAPGSDFQSTGWPQSVLPPQRQYFNWLLNWLSGGVRYLLQMGIAEWSATETYPINARVTASDGGVYKSLMATTGDNPTSSPAKWVRWGDGSKITLQSGNYANLQAAVNAAQALGGAIIELPQGAINLSSTLTITGNNIVLRGAGAAIHHDVGSITPTTSLVWTGSAGGVMVEIAPTEGAANQKSSGCKIENIAFNSNASAGVGLSLKSHNSGRFEDIAFYNGFSVYTISIGVVNTLGEARDCQHNVFDGVVVSSFDAGTGYIIRLAGDATANASFNTFRNVSISHYNAHAIVLENADNNEFFTTHIFRAAGGAGVGVIFAGGATVDQVARVNHFFGLSATGGVLAQAGTASSYDNVIYCYDKGNGSPDPTIQAGATLHWSTDTGIDSGWAGISGAFGDNATTAAAARAVHTNETLRIRNDSNAHLILDDTAGHSGAIRMVGYDIETLPLDGSGKTALVRPVARYSTVDSVLFGVLKNQVAPQTVSNTVTETGVFSYTIPANTLGTNKKLKLRLHYSAVKNSGDATVTAFSINGYLGGTAMWTADALLAVNTATNSTGFYHGFVDVEVAPNDATNSQKIEMYRMGTSGTTSTAAGSVGNGSTNTSTAYNTLSKDMTASQTLSIKAKISVANAGNVFTLHSAELVLI